LLATLPACPPADRDGQPYLRETECRVRITEYRGLQRLQSAECCIEC